ncbi:hypothetical protein appser2_7250 [Actinobacillus pleuropneumoniae serovar 2 str. S1536]|nr:hypothetical protein appser2_7250 [Actinobacillus pleuropneumoniae serovar 2 str. S1536]EFM90111.1 hypothetical protein appser4_7630 [Actinobacillus pleuropneumoniae serovar 4 str. M62]
MNIVEACNTRTSYKIKDVFDTPLRDFIDYTEKMTACANFLRFQVEQAV